METIFRKCSDCNVDPVTLLPERYYRGVAKRRGAVVSLCIIFLH